jgi:hypothetical protein
MWASELRTVQELRDSHLCKSNGMIHVDVEGGIAVPVYRVLAPFATWRLPEVTPWRFEHASTWANNIHASKLTFAGFDSTLELFPLRNIGFYEDCTWFGGRCFGILLDKFLGFWAKREVRNEDAASAGEKQRGETVVNSLHIYQQSL